MSGRLTDTSPEAEQVLREIDRRMPPDRKWLRLGGMYRTARLLHEAGERARNPAATVDEVHEAWLTEALGEELIGNIKERPVAPNDESLSVLREVIAVLNRLEIPYAVGGSLASSFLGKPRFTFDADITVEPFAGKEDGFCAAFGPDYYLSLVAVREAIERRSSFNIVYTPSGFKVDVFVRKDRPFDLSVMQRRQIHSVGEPAAPASIVVVSPEDIILLKLEWYRIGNETSERQWTDVLGVLDRQAEKLHLEYLNYWAKELRVGDLLAKARQEAGV